MTSPSERRIRVTRTLVYEGLESWVRHTLEKSWVGTQPFVVASGTIVQTSLVSEVLPAEEDDDAA